MVEEVGPPPKYPTGSVGAFRQTLSSFASKNQDSSLRLGHFPPEKVVDRSPEQKIYVDKLLSDCKKGKPLFAQPNFFNREITDMLTHEEYTQGTKDYLQSSRRPTFAEQDKDKKESDRFYLIQADNRLLPRKSDADLNREVTEGIVKFIQHNGGIDFDSKCVDSSVECTYFCTTREKLAKQQIGVLCLHKSKLAEKLIKFANERPDARVQLGKTNIRFRILKEKPVPHVKVSVRVIDEELLLDREGVSLALAMLLRLDECRNNEKRQPVEEDTTPPIRLLSSTYVGKSNVFEWTLSGEQIPSDLINNNILKVHQTIMYMRFPGGPFPCKVCNTFDHSTMGCEVYREKKKMERCQECSETGHSRAACPKRQPPECFACHQPGHFKIDCPNIECFKCGTRGHMIKHCTKKGPTATRKKATTKTKKKKAAAAAPPTSSKRKEGVNNMKNKEQEAAPDNVADQAQPTTTAATTTNSSKQGNTEGVAVAGARRGGGEVVEAVEEEEKSSVAPDDDDNRMEEKNKLVEDEGAGEVDIETIVTTQKDLHFPALPQLHRHSPPPAADGGGAADDDDSGRRSRAGRSGPAAAAGRRQSGGGGVKRSSATPDAMVGPRQTPIKERSQDQKKPKSGDSQAIVSLE